MPRRFDRLTLKLTLVGVVFAVLMSLATALLVTRGFREAQQNAAARSAQGLEMQGRDALRTLTVRQAQLSAAHFSQAASAGRIAAQYLASLPGLGGGVSWDAARHLGREPAGQYWDPDPARITDIFIPRSQAISAAQMRDLRDSAALDAVFPALWKQIEDVSAIYYVSPHAVFRYYPVIGIAQLLPPDYPMLRNPSYADAIPAADPQRTTVWRAPYINPEHTGVLVTASTPIYAGAAFRGVIGVDVSLSGLISHLNALKPTPTGYAFLIDRSGGLVAAPPSALADLVGQGAPPGISPTTILGMSLVSGTQSAAFTRTLDAMRKGGQGSSRIQLGGRPVVLAYAPLADLGWSMGVVAPISEITLQSASVAAEIDRDAGATIWSTLAAIGICFALVLLITLALSRWLLIRPIGELMAATRAIAAGDLSVTIPVTRDDELGQLARSFNRMTTELAQFYEILEQRVQERTRELSTLLEVSRNVTSTLELAPLLDVILDQLRSMVDYSSATILTLEGETLVVLEYRGPAPREQVVGLRFPLATAALHETVVRDREPVIVADSQGDTPVALAFTHATGQSWGEAFGSIRSWMGVPLILKERVIGMLAIVNSEPAFYTPHHAQLAAVIAAHAAVAIENARLYAQAQELAAFKERSRLARELHDSVSQALYGIALGARTARAQLDRDPGRVVEPLDYVLSLAQAGLTEMRALIFELRPESLATEGLIVALNHQVAALRARHEMTVQATLGEEPDVPFAVKEATYRIAQEALHNIVKHARATTVVVKLAASAEALCLEIDDDGLGFEREGSFPGHLGLRSMEERALALGGTLRVDSTPGRGTRVRAYIPCHRAA